MRGFPRRRQRVGGVAIEALVEMSLDVENGADAGVPEPGGDDGGMHSMLDQEGMAMAEIVEPHWLSHPRPLDRLETKIEKIEEGQLFVREP